MQSLRAMTDPKVAFDILSKGDSHANLKMCPYCLNQGTCPNCGSKEGPCLKFVPNETPETEELVERMLLQQVCLV